MGLAIAIIIASYILGIMGSLAFWTTSYIKHPNIKRQVDAEGIDSRIILLWCSIVWPWALYLLITGKAKL